MSDSKPIFPDGVQGNTEDIAAAGDAGWRAKNRVHAAMRKIPIEGADRKGYVIPVHEGPLVVDAGASGKVTVRPFWFVLSPGGATVNPGTENASGSSEDREDLLVGYFPGEQIAVPTPLPSAGNARWDMLLATATETDSDAATRTTLDVTTTPASIGPKTVFTRHRLVVTLSWRQGVAVAVATDPYPSINLPTLPTPDAGAANVKLTYVRVQNSGAPSTVTYGIDDIANAPTIARANTQGDLMSAGGGAAFTEKDSAVPINPTIENIIAGLTIAKGGWPLTGSNVRPPSFIERMAGVHVRFIHLGPFSNGATKSWVAGWRVLSQPIFTPDLANPNYDDAPIDWRDRWFFSALAWGRGTAKSAHDMTGSSATAWTPNGFSDVVQWSPGQSFRANNNFDAETTFTANLYAPAAIWRKVGGVVGGTDHDDIALVVKRDTGALHLAAREENAGIVNGHTGVAIVLAGPRFFEPSFA